VGTTAATTAAWSPALRRLLGATAVTTQHSASAAALGGGGSACSQPARLACAGSSNSSLPATNQISGDISSRGVVTGALVCPGKPLVML
jgi:hypothetical protein